MADTSKASTSMEKYTVHSLDINAETVCSKKLRRLGQVVEYYLPRNVCQSRINGRDSSSACCVIATLVAQAALANELRVTDCLQPPSRLCLQKFVQCIRKGNGIYDKAGCGAVLSTIYQAISLCGGIKITPHKDLVFKSQENCQRQLEKQAKWMLEEERGGVAAAVIVQHPVSIALVFSDMLDSVAIFDSHGHGPKQGALVAVLRQQQRWDVLSTYLSSLLGGFQNAQVCFLELCAK